MVYFYLCDRLLQLKRKAKVKRIIRDWLAKNGSLLDVDKH